MDKCDKIFFLLALGSNTEAKKNIKQAQNMINSLWNNCIFSSAINTKPIDIQSPDFINMIVCGWTTNSYEDIKKQIKQIENHLHSTKEERKKGVVRMDIDLLQYGTNLYKENDWKRAYIQQLVEELSQQAAIKAFLLINK
ncbi:MAG: 2-amino-4-hydroxy-6-hydroxymethyldihydropteridine diphosphokinase [Prevotella sp.]|nr:2-amino-4-hydroxy-6-hydroxymethyldihydropteridine diphosphokinase [Prevotella sp.]